MTDNSNNNGSTRQITKNGTSHKRSVLRVAIKNVFKSFSFACLLIFFVCLDAYFSFDADLLPVQKLYYWCLTLALLANRLISEYYDEKERRL